jgi:hypothetical protein
VLSMKVRSSWNRPVLQVAPLRNLECFLEVFLRALLVMASATGCAAVVSPARAPTEADFAAIQPGMRSQEVLDRFGRPTSVFGVRQEDLTIWNYRFNRSDCIIHQASVRPDGSVRDSGTASDPACARPD